MPTDEDAPIVAALNVAAQDYLPWFWREHPHVMFLEVKLRGDAAMIHVERAQHRHLVAQRAEEAAAVIIASARLWL